MNTDKTQTEQVVNRMNDLAVETTQTLVDAAYLAQKQSAQLLQAWLGTLDSSQQAQRDVASRLVKQAQEAQNLLQQFVQQTFQANFDTLNRTAQSGFRQASDTMNTSAQQASTTAKRTETGTTK